MGLIAESTSDLAALASVHPALIDSVTRWRGVGGWGATATIMQAVEIGAVELGLAGESVSLRLVPGVATSKKAHSAGPFVEQGHVQELMSFDRHLLKMLFDDIAHAPCTDMATLSGFRRRHPLEFWTLLKTWRQSVDAEATRLQASGRLAGIADLLDECRHGIVDALHDESLSNRQWGRIAAVALVAHLDDVVARTAERRLDSNVSGSLTGPSAIVWLASLRSGKRSGIEVVRRLFSPLRPSSYPPAQYVTLTLPPHRRARIIDDGSLRLGG